MVNINQNCFLSSVSSACLYFSFYAFFFWVTNLNYCCYSLLTNQQTLSHIELLLKLKTNKYNFLLWYTIYRLAMNCCRLLILPLYLADIGENKDICVTIWKNIMMGGFIQFVILFKFIDHLCLYTR
jgi:hypothetical protein